jgi:hypothetical protein
MPLLISQPSLVLSYLKYRDIPEHRLPTWHLLLSAFGSSSLDLNKRVSILNALLATTQQGGLAWATPSGKELQGFTEQLLAEAFNGSSVSANAITSILKTPGKADCRRIYMPMFTLYDRPVHRLFRCARSGVEYSDHNRVSYISSHTNLIYICSSSPIVS